MSNVDLPLITCGAMIQALRGDRDALELLLDSLDAGQLRQLAAEALMGMARAIEATNSTSLAEQIALGIQDHIYDREGNQS